MSTSETRKTINKLKKMKTIITDKVTYQFLRKSLEWIRNRAVKNLNKSVNKKYPHPTSYARDYVIVINLVAGTAKLTNSDPNSAAMEFGIGIEGKQSPHELAEEKGYQYDVNNHDIEGWKFKLPDGTTITTRGYGAKSFLYKAVADYMNEKKWVEIYTKIINKKLERLSKNKR